MSRLVFGKVGRVGFLCFFSRSHARNQDGRSQTSQMRAIASGEVAPAPRSKERAKR